MDADVEMIHMNGSGVVAAEDLNMSLPMDFPEPKPRQGRCVVVSFSLFIFAAIVLSGGVLFIRKEQIESNVRDQGQSSSQIKHDDAEEEDTRQWLQANVSLRDGIKYEVVRQLEHDPAAFTEGLAYANGVLYESTGLRGQSSIRTLNVTTGRVIKSYPLVDNKYFGEGLTYANGKLYQLTYKKKTGFIYDAANLTKPPETFSFDTTTGEGWGMTYDLGRNEFIVSDGSEFLHFWDGNTMRPLRKVKVRRQNRRKARNVNELEWWRGRILANVWFQDIILVIHPETGVVEKEYDFNALWPSDERGKVKAGVLNGISVSEDPRALYFTGKNWDRMYLVKLLN